MHVVSFGRKVFRSAILTPHIHCRTFFGTFIVLVEEVSGIIALRCLKHVVCAPRRTNHHNTAALLPQVRNRGPDKDVSHNGRDHGHDGGDGPDGDERWQREERMIARDVEARLGAMAVHAMSRFGEGAAPVLDEWKRRFLDRPLLFVLGGSGR